MANLAGQVQQLRGEGLTDSLIMEELSKQGFKAEEIHAAISGVESSASSAVPPMPGSFAQPGMAPAANVGPAPVANPMPLAIGEDANIYERIEAITESMIDEKWDELISEVKKIVEWKEKIEERQNSIISDLTKLKEDFKTLHQGVLGKLGNYDTRMRDVDTELKAVGKVFKDVIPVFVENVKELSHITGKVKNK
tara:strand:- start:246 stop:830 length:585 start_codon:yes stop_codon:yes gene_type:complete